MTAANEPQRRTLYEFDWAVPARKLSTGLREAESGIEYGWWDGRNWVAAFGDGAWSPQFVTAFRPMKVVPA